MPRPKGSKNKVKEVVTVAVEDIEAQIAEQEAEVERLGAELKAAKAGLKELLKEKAKAKAKAEAAALAAKAEEDKAKILEALEKSGKSVEEILELQK